MTEDSKLQMQIVKTMTDPEPGTIRALTKLLSNDVGKWRYLIAAASIAIN